MTVTMEVRDGEALALIETKSWRGEIALTTGANLLRLRHRAMGLDLLRFPESMADFHEKPEVWGIPVLFPPNRIAEGQFNFDGRLYRYPLNEIFNYNHMHGFLSRRPWQLGAVEESDDSCSVELLFEHTIEDDFYDFFPHAFTVSLVYTFNAQAVDQTISITNRSDLPMPFGLGFHTVFRQPFGEQTQDAYEACRVRIATGDTFWELARPRIHPTEASIPFTEDERWDTPEGLIAAGRNVSRHCPVVPIEAQGKPFIGAILTSPADQATVIYRVDEKFTHWMLWNYQGDKFFFCPEPQTCMVNAPNLSLCPEVSGAAGLAPSVTWTGHSSIEVHASDKPTS